MRPASAQDIAQLSDLMFAAVYDDNWSAAAGKLKQVMNSSSAAFGLLDTRTYQSTVLYGDCEEQYARTVFAPEMGNPLGPVLAASPVGMVTSDRLLMPDNDHRRSTFFNEWLLPQGEKSFIAVKTSGGRMAGMVGTNRGLGQPDVDDSDLRLFERLTPLLMQVTRLRVQVGALRLGERADSYDRLRIGMAVTDKQGRLLHANSAADSILSDPQSGLDAHRGGLQAGRQTWTLRRLIADAASQAEDRPGLGGHVAVTSPDGLVRSLALTVAPMPDAGRYGLPAPRAAIVFMQRFEALLGDAFEQQVAMLFGLTRREAELAAALTRGLSVRDAADLHRISIHTARTHLAQLFAKTGTGQQSQLVALLARLINPEGHV
jgi:DNA-binding CsgD family transcriptional regulator